ncbi:hypothetical protein HDU87_000860 [Geranomyces variabilis]|uniref:Uncharacterized protein n=1 Tax=Geranomyces variabilis TaxID=109894 RepID=A0AAD5TBN3_9FUNG|nr:hypothetical protein HDU87_000860 [Geranomyces variabilis]
MFTGDKTPNRPAADGKWVPNDIRDPLGDKPEEFEQLGGLQDAMNAWEDDVSIKIVDDSHAIEHLNSVEGYNPAAAKLNGKGYGNAGLRTRPVTYTAPNASTGPEALTPGQDLASFAADTKDAGSGACRDRPNNATPIESMVSALNSAHSVLAIQCLPSCAIGKSGEAAKSAYLSA